MLIGLGLALVAGGAQAASKCDGGVTKAIGKKIACACGVYAKSQQKGTPLNTAKLQKCSDKFTKACTKAVSAGDCQIQTQSCTTNESEADNVVAGECASSPSGAFLE
jgi:hypothetical protein